MAERQRAGRQGRESDCPKEGILLGYDFQAPSAGKYEIWNRIGMEFVRSPFEWRIDEGEWQTITPRTSRRDLMELGFWNEVAWYRMGEADLTAGKHTLQIRLMPTYKEENGQEGPEQNPVLLRRAVHLQGHVPAERQVQARRRLADRGRQARRPSRSSSSTRRGPAAAAAGQRVETPLAGCGRSAATTSRRSSDRAGPTKTLPDAAAAYWMSIPVPGNKFEVKPELRFCHRFVYRTRVNVPAELAGRSFFLRLPSHEPDRQRASSTASSAAGRKAPFAQWECDVTQRHPARPGQRGVRGHQGCLLRLQREEVRQELPADRSTSPVSWMGSRTGSTRSSISPSAADYGDGSRASSRRPASSWPGRSTRRDVFAHAVGARTSNWAWR